MTSSTATPGVIVAAILLPPLGVFLGERRLGSDFWIATVLTLLGWLPGVLWSLFAILRPRAELARA
ncbi:MAG: YqaE/Pmp3 family membrane protein [Sphingomonadaceae bacterium]|nr:YqaE/Pmp3 family membrane protein [Sphingomonadaceae bacterium]